MVGWGIRRILGNTAQDVRRIHENPAQLVFGLPAARCAGCRWDACERTEKAQFWQHWAGTPMNARQTPVLNQVLNGMEAKLAHAEWAAMGKGSAGTA